MVVSDAWVVGHWAQAEAMHYPAAVIGALIVVAAGHWIGKRKQREIDARHAQKTEG